MSHSRGLPFLHGQHLLPCSQDAPEVHSLERMAHLNPGTPEQSSVLSEIAADVFSKSRNHTSEEP